MQSRRDVVPQFLLSSFWTELGISSLRQLGNGEQVLGMFVAEE
jgi:hypothetical protein